MGILSSQWDKLLIQNWKGSTDYIRSLRKGDAADEGTISANKITSRKISENPRGSMIPPRASLLPNQNGAPLRNSNYDPDSFFTFKEYNARSKFIKNKRVSIMKQRLQTKDLHNKNFEIIPSIMPHALEINPGIKMKKEL